MELYSKGKAYTLYNGSMLDLLQVIEPNSLDSIVTDPPYELNFMGKGWDNSGIAFQKNTWEQCLKALKPGGYLLSFGGSRTYHRIACAIEDAGFEIRDTIMWLYGCLSEDTEVLTDSGYKTIDKITVTDKIQTFNCATREFGWEVPSALNQYSVENECCYSIKSPFTDQLVSRNHRCIVKSGDAFDVIYAENLAGDEYFPVIIDDTVEYTKAIISKELYTGVIFCPTVSTGCFVARRNGKVFITGNSGFPKSMNIGLAIDKKNGVESPVVGVGKSGEGDTHSRCMHSVSESGDVFFGGEYEIRQAQNEWSGWGTALKPAFEPIIVARKPCEGSCVDNVLKYGVGGINIDECRVPLESDYVYKETNRNPRASNVFTGETCGFKSEDNHTAVANPNGRFPSNVILTYDDTDKEEVCGGMPETTGTIRQPTGGKILNPNSGWNNNSMTDSTTRGFDDEGSAARYFYCAKASNIDRDEGLDNFEAVRTGSMEANINGVMQLGGASLSGEPKEIQPKKNIHPTVKPTSLMSYLIRLVTPKGGTVLDPFNGSGSTGKAAMYENYEREAGYKYIGIELSPEYLAISDARLKYVENKLKQIKLF